MQDMPSFKFQGFTLRPAVFSDYSLAMVWVEADPDHRGKTPAEFWLINDDRTNSFVLEDAVGPIFFFRTDRHETEVELHMQFGPTYRDYQLKRRTMQGMKVGLPWLEMMLAGAGYQELYFYSSSPKLIWFCQHSLAFRWDGRRLEKELVAPLTQTPIQPR